MRVDAGTPEEDGADAIDLEAAARDVWEDGLRLSDLAAEAPREFRFQAQEGLLQALQAHIAGLSSEQAQVCTLPLALLNSHSALDLTFLSWKLSISMAQLDFGSRPRRACCVCCRPT